MTRRWHNILRKAAPILGAGVLLQAGSCAVDTNAVAEGLTTAVANGLITSFVFSVFGVPFAF